MNIGDEVIISAKVVGITESNNPIIQVKSGVRMLIKESDISTMERWWDLPEGEKEPPVFIDSAPLKDCKNTAESYGEICVKCNKCGRFGREKE